MHGTPLIRNVWYVKTLHDSIG